MFHAEVLPIKEESADSDDVEINKIKEESADSDDVEINKIKEETADSDDVEINKIKKEILAKEKRMAGFTENQISEFQEAFNLFDAAGDGKIPASDIGSVLRAVGQNPTEAEVKKLTRQLRPDQRITFDIFLPILHDITRNRNMDTADDFISGLRHFDKDGNGFISSAELRHLLTTLGERLSNAEVDELLQGHEDSQGNVNYEEFVKAVMTG